ncbi:mechanosensitive ion channel family protein [Patescibacteria group bacterium]|nr:mechanosensitive ion channel family protein [Patescibacteria group bacterium]
MNLQNILQNITPWILSHGIKIILILIGAWLIDRIIKIFISKGVKSFVTQTYRIRDGKALEKRSKTLEGVLEGAVSIIVLLIAGLMVVSELGINIGPLLALAGVAGLAFGFGGQYLIRDLISGLFIILEDQYRVGDVACVADTCGLVEDINLRRTILRDLDGIVHHIPNGEITKASNLSKGFSRVNLNIGVSYGSDLEKVINVVNKVCNELAEDPQWKQDILKTPQFLRVDDFADSAVIIKILGDTKPLRQWDVTGELRKRIKIAFDKEGIEIPFPQMSVWPRGKFEK